MAPAAEVWSAGTVVIPAPPPLAWARSHAALPATHVDPEGALRVYFSSRDERGRSHIARAIVDPGGGDPRFDPDPVLSPGPLGAFDDSGVTMSCLLDDGERLLLYYSGWSLGRTVPFYLAIGCAVSTDGGRSFERLGAGPIVGRSIEEPYMSASPWVVADARGYRMFYVSCTGWTMHEDEPRHHYRIQQAVSDDPLSWQPEGDVALDYEGDEYAMGRPCVLRDADGWRMWFCSRGDRYALRCAESADGSSWRRSELHLSPTGDWDSEMQAYPCVFDHEGTRHMLYNGNGYGASGIGLAHAA